MLNWFMENWILLTAISGGLYIAVSILEKVVNKKKESVSVNKETEADVQVQ